MFLTRNLVNLTNIHVMYTMKMKDSFMEYREIGPNDFSGLMIFVRKLVRKHLRRDRVGIMLGLANMGFQRGAFVGGLHFVGTNEIFLNRNALNVMKNETGDPELYKAYILFLLLHEYIHAVGITDERATRQITQEIILKEFDKDHPVGQLATKGLNALFPYTFADRTHIPTPQERVDIEIIMLRHPDSELTYI